MINTPIRTVRVSAIGISLLQALLIIIFAMFVGLQVNMSYAWSFTESTFGGWVGLILPPTLTIAAFMLGMLYRDFSR